MSDYEPSDSESDYAENEKILLQNARRGNYESSDESEEEVFNVGPNDDDTDDEEDEIELADSDVEGQAEEDHLPNEKAWGKDKRKFYSTDFVDPDYEEYDEKSARLAELEEEEAIKLQMKLAEQLDDDDFDFEFLKEGSDEVLDDLVEEKIKFDTSKLTKREKINFLKIESPELFGLLKDFKDKTDIYKNFLEPVLRKYRKGQIPNSSAMDFVQIFNDLILNYCVNIYMYLLLKSHKTALDNHPVVKRLYQYRQLIEKLREVFEEVVKEQILVVLDEKVIAVYGSIHLGNIEKKVPDKPKNNKRKTLKLLEKVEAAEPEGKKKKKEKKILKEMKDDIEKDNKVAEDKELPKNKNDNSPEEFAENNKLEKRGITYQIAKNKGLTPHRKKELRNPRVKHRNKFRKAKIRRKGAVREVRNELKRYGGEISGIKATVTKSIKLKS